MKKLWTKTRGQGARFLPRRIALALTDTIQYLDSQKSQPWIELLERYRSEAGTREASSEPASCLHMSGMSHGAINFEFICTYRIHTYAPGQADRARAKRTRREQRHVVSLMESPIAQSSALASKLLLFFLNSINPSSLSIFSKRVYRLIDQVNKKLSCW